MNKNNHNNQDTFCPVVNLSSHNLTTAQTSVLSKGLSFCPTPRATDLAVARRDLDTFHRSLKLWCFFQEKATNEDPNSSQLSDNDTQVDTIDNQEIFSHRKFRNKSTWTPTGPLPLETMILMNEIHLTNSQARCPQKANLSRAERLALAELKQLRDVIIKPADKGSAVVLLNKSDYISEAKRQLDDTKFYSRVDTDLTQEHFSKVKEIISQMYTNEQIDKKCMLYLGSTM